MRGMGVRGMRCCVNAHSKERREKPSYALMHVHCIFFNEQALVPALARKGVEPNKRNLNESFLMRKLASED